MPIVPIARRPERPALREPRRPRCAGLSFSRTTRPPSHGRPFSHLEQTHERERSLCPHVRRTLDEPQAQPVGACRGLPPPGLPRQTGEVAEGRRGCPNRADLDAIVKRTVDTMVPIFRREQEVAARTDPQPEPPPPEPNIFRRWRPILGPMLPEPPPIDFEPLPEPAPDPKDEVPPSRYPGQNIG